MSDCALWSKIKYKLAWLLWGQYYFLTIIFFLTILKRTAPLWELLNKKCYICLRYLFGGSSFSLSLYVGMMIMIVILELFHKLCCVFLVVFYLEDIMMMMNANQIIVSWNFFYASGIAPYWMNPQVESNTVLTYWVYLLYKYDV